MSDFSFRFSTVLKFVLPLKLCLGNVSMHDYTLSEELQLFELRILRTFGPTVKEPVKTFLPRTFYHISGLDISSNPESNFPHL